MHDDQPSPPVLDGWALALARVEGIAHSAEEEAFLSALALMPLSSDERAQAALSYLGYGTASG